MLYEIKQLLNFVQDKRVDDLGNTRVNIYLGQTPPKKNPKLKLSLILETNTCRNKRSVGLMNLPLIFFPADWNGPSARSEFPF